MSDSFQETKTTNYITNVKNSFSGICIGIICFVIAVAVLWFNERNCAMQNQIARYINKNAIVVDSASVDRANDNKLISTSGELTTTNLLSDGIVSSPNSLVLKRTVEMYQWEEDKDTRTETKMGGTTTETTTYTYKKFGLKII